MALTFSDGFDSYAATADLLKNWARAGSVWAWSAGADQNAATGGIISAATTANTYLSTPAGAFGLGQTRVAVGFWLKVSAAPASQIEIAHFYGYFGNSGLPLARITLNASGFLGLAAGSGTQHFTGATNVADGGWHWIEVSPQIGTTVLQRCLADGVSQWNANSSIATVDTFCYLDFTSVLNRTISISDVICYNDAGTAFTVAANFPFGPRNITTRRPNGDDVIQFTRSTGTSSFALVDEVNGDVTDYVESGTASQQDTYDYEALGFTPTVINAVMLKSYLFNPLPGSINHTPIAKSGGVVASGVDVLTPSVRPAVLHQAFYTDPATAAAWTAAGFDAAKFGIKVSPVGLPPLLDGLSGVSGAWSISRPLYTAYVASLYTTSGGGFISLVEDQSGNNRDLTTNAADTNRPAPVTAGPNSRACADFDGSDYFMATTLSSFISAGAGYMIVGAMFDTITAAAGGGAFWDHAIVGDAGGYVGLFVSEAGTPDKISAYNYDGTQDYAASNAVVVGTPYVLEWKHEGGNVSLRVNGGTWINTPSGNTSNLGFTLQFGTGYSVAGSYFDFKLFEAVVFSTIPSAGTQDALAANMKTWIGA